MQTAKLGSYTVYFENGEEYHRIKREVWGANGYYFESEKEKPVIIDAGAHIGLTTLYFKRLFPDSTIIALEPHPDNAKLFRKNMFENQIEGVTLEEIALAEYEGEKEFFYDETEEKWYSTAGFVRGAWNKTQESKRIIVQTKTLDDYLEIYRPDLVKLDIEGAEEKVIVAAKDSLSKCPHYLIEFHPVEGVGMERIIRVFEERGFRVTVSKGGKIVPWQKAIGLSFIEAVKN